MKHHKVLVLGGSGFVGRHLVNRLIRDGRRVTVPVRRRDKAKHLLVYPTIDVVEANIHDDAVLAQLVAGQDAVINLVGILQGSAADFERAHAALTRRTVAACEAAGVTRYQHMSALGASETGPSMYQRSKGAAEAAVRASRLDWTIYQPSVVFGPEDKFLNMFATLARFAPVLPVGGAEVKFQPVWVEDVAAAFANTLDNQASFHQSYPLAGPRVYTLRELVRFAASASGHPRPVLALPEGVARLQARLMELAPGEPLLSRDNLDSMKVDNVAPAGWTPAPELDIAHASMETEAVHYLAGRHPRTHYDAMRSRAKR